MDRYTILADRTLDILTEYWYQCGRPPRYSVSKSGNRRISGYAYVFWTALLKKSSERARIVKHVTSHAFRHSFTSHLLKAGCDIKYIQALLGHFAPNIINCKTGAYGTNVSICENCEHPQIHYNSCRNRCCPMCQALPKELSHYTSLHFSTITTLFLQLIFRTNGAKLNIINMTGNHIDYLPYKTISIKLKLFELAKIIFVLNKSV